jgi:hypothetical protein
VTIPGEIGKMRSNGRADHRIATTAKREQT